MYKTISTLFLLVGFHQNLRASLADSLQSERMEEVEVKAYSPRTLSDDRNGRLYWNMESLADMPHVLGSADPLRSLQLLPGVATNNDYTSGIHIQGCAASQSVLNMDGAPIFNASHLLGLFPYSTPPTSAAWHWSRTVTMPLSPTVWAEKFLSILPIHSP